MYFSTGASGPPAVKTVGMADSFMLAHPLSPPTSGGSKLRVLVTGAAGRIGSYFSKHADGKYDLKLLVHESDDVSAVESLGEVVVGDVTNLESFKAAATGVDVILHLAGDPSPHATWDSLLPVNIVGTYNCFAAAKEAGVRRVVFASSIHAVSGYPRERQVHPAMPVNPGDLYGVSKCFGEALGRHMAEREGVGCIVVRIGAFQPIAKAEDPAGLGLLDAFVSRRDLNQLLQKSVEADHLKFAIVHGLSDNSFNFMDISSARELLGYEPQDDLAQMNPELEKLHLHEVLVTHHQTSAEESGLRNDVDD